MYLIYIVSESIFIYLSIYRYLDLSILFVLFIWRTLTKTGIPKGNKYLVCDAGNTQHPNRFSIVC